MNSIFPNEKAPMKKMLLWLFVSFLYEAVLTNTTDRERNKLDNLKRQISNVNVNIKIIIFFVTFNITFIILL